MPIRRVELGEEDRAKFLAARIMVPIENVTFVPPPVHEIDWNHIYALATQLLDMPYPTRVCSIRELLREDKDARVREGDICP